MSASTRGVNPTADFDRVPAPVVGAGSIDFGRSHKHYAAIEASATGEEKQNSSDARKVSEDVATTSTNRVLDTWKNIQAAEMKEGELIGKV